VLTPLRRSAWAVAVGGIAGSIVRWALATWSTGSIEAPTWPWWTLAANVAGCLVIGAIAARLPYLPPDRVVLWRDGLATGFCGGLTTFSTFSVELAAMLRAHRPGLAAGYLLTSLVTGYLAYEAGRRAAHARYAPSAPSTPSAPSAP
jgi:CrcB protein